MVRDGRVRLARFTLEDHSYGASRLPKTTVLQSSAVRKRKSAISMFYISLRSLVVFKQVERAAKAGKSKAERNLGARFHQTEKSNRQATQASSTYILCFWFAFCHSIALELSI